MAKTSPPPLVPFPPASVRLSIAPEEWTVCVDTWLTLVDFYLRLPTADFSSSVAQQGNGKEFLRSFYHEAAHAEAGDVTLNHPTVPQLKKACFRLSRRILSESKEAVGLLDFEYLADLCHVHARSTASSQLMSEVWKQHEKQLASVMQSKKSHLLKATDSSMDQTAQTQLHQLPPIMLASPEAASLLMTGSDFLDSIASAYRRSSSAESRKDLTAIAYLGLQSLIKTTPSNYSLLIDHLYGLKTEADANLNASSSLIADLVTNTALLTKLRHHAGDGGGQRLLKLLDTVETYRSPSIARPKKPRQRRITKSKGKANQSHDDMHIHQMSLVTQIQDLFPDLGSSFVLKLLDEYDDNVEQVTAHLLDDSLPAHLHGLDRTEEVPIHDIDEKTDLEHLAPRSTPPPSQSFIPQRRNVFDDDELDRLEVDASRLHLGKRTHQPTSTEPNKAAIFSALAAFDSDDDERDDTYDVEDVGGTVDTAHPDGEPGPSAKITSQENDMTLLAAYKSLPHLFGRTTEIRRGQPRQALKRETGMTDEAIEGWAIMLQRDPRRLQRLEAQSGSFDGQQGELARTAYRDSAPGTETEDSDGPAERGGFRGRGRGRGRGGRGRGNVAGPTSDPKTAAAQRNKETNKGSRANHNRRDQRARKMARGGFPS